MNYYSFSRFFKRVSGRSFNDHLLEVRLNNSQKKLLQSDMPISDVALSCGFEYPSYFIRKFKSKYGMTPKEYREKYR
ncbi:MAG: helix-turn-helix transcriptional regulator [Clostridia bacterium]|nr:helix-turn-helix transcriptional regulator [Clostridia bacterium]